MLKISPIEDPKGRRLAIQGKLIPPWTAELKRACDQAGAEVNDRQLILHVLTLTAISPEGETILLELMRQGVKLRSSGVFDKQVLRQRSGRLRPVDGVTPTLGNASTGLRSQRPDHKTLPEVKG